MDQKVRNNLIIMIIGGAMVLFFLALSLIVRGVSTPLLPFFLLPLIFGTIMMFVGASELWGMFLLRSEASYTRAPHRVETPIPDDPLLSAENALAHDFWLTHQLYQKYFFTSLFGVTTGIFWLILIISVTGQIQLFAPSMYPLLFILVAVSAIMIWGIIRSYRVVSAGRQLYKTLDANECTALSGAITQYIDSLLDLYLRGGWPSLREMTLLEKLVYLEGEWKGYLCMLVISTVSAAYTLFQFTAQLLGASVSLILVFGYLILATAFTVALLLGSYFYVHWILRSKRWINAFVHANAWMENLENLSNARETKQ